MKESHPIEGLMLTAMSSIHDMVDVNTIIGEPIESVDGMTIIPISKVSFGFAAGGSEFAGETLKEYNRKNQDEEIEYKLPFGGGAGAHANITPIAFVVESEGNVKLLHLDEGAHKFDKVIDIAKDILDKMNLSNN